MPGGDGASGERAGVGEEREVAPPFAAFTHKRLGGQHRVEQYLEAVDPACRRGDMGGRLNAGALWLARHYRGAEGLSIARIAERLGRSPATVKAYSYDRLKRPRCS
jgi:hypothetical protein